MSLLVAHDSKHKKWKCLYCEKLYEEEENAYNCSRKHEIVLVPLAKEDLHRLLQFIYFKQDAVLNETIFRILKQYNKTASIRRPEDYD